MEELLRRRDYQWENHKGECGTNRVLSKKDLLGRTERQSPQLKNHSVRGVGSQQKSKDARGSPQGFRLMDSGGIPESAWMFQEKELDRGRTAVYEFESRR